MVQAIVTTGIRKHKEQEIENPKASPLLCHLPALEKMLWGGTLMLIVDHIINGEVTWRYPFFTALNEFGGGSVMLKEMLTVGVPMSLALTFAWIVYAYVKAHNAKTKVQKA